MDALIICNDGQDIEKTNFWDEDEGLFYVSYNAGALRLLVPESQEPMLKELKNIREVIVSRGPWPSRRIPDAIEVLFEDDSDAPFSMQVGINQIDILPANKDNGRGFVFSVWTMGSKKVKEFPGRVRIVSSIPCLKKWGE